MLLYQCSLEPRNVLALFWRPFPSLVMLCEDYAERHATLAEPCRVLQIYGLGRDAAVHQQQHHYQCFPLQEEVLGELVKLLAALFASACISADVRASAEVEGHHR